MSRTGWWGVGALWLAAPFEAWRPVLRLPGQSISSLELVMGGVALTMVLTAVVARGQGSGTTWGSAVLWPLVLCVLAAVAASAFAPFEQANAWRMTVRYATAASVTAWATTAIADRRALARISSAAIVSGVVAAFAVAAEFAGLADVTAFHPGSAFVGSQLRPSGTFQYPTMASMFLELTFALAVGWLWVNVTGRRRAAAWMAATAALVMAGAITLTLTRAGLVSMALVLVTAGWLATRQRHWGLVGVLAGIAVGIGVELAAARAPEALQLRLTTEGPTAWHRASFTVPTALTLRTGASTSVPIRLRNEGRATWRSDVSDAVNVAYHWIEAETDRVVVWEGRRTPLAAPVPAGDTVDLVARVDAPSRPGRYRLVWDLELTQRLWFSTEPNAIVAMTAASVDGEPVPAVRAPGGPDRLPRPIARPGRGVLWSTALSLFRAYPWLGVGPDNFRFRNGGLVAPPLDDRVHSNNMYIEVAVGMGLVGATCLAWLGLRVARSVVSLIGSDDGWSVGVALALIAASAHGLVDSFLAFTPIYLALALTVAMAVAAQRLEDAHAHRV